MRNRYLYFTILTLLGLSAEAVAQTAAQGKQQADTTQAVTVPQLVVTIAIDQLRTDRMETYASLYKYNGLNRLLAEGMVFSADAGSCIGTVAFGSLPDPQPLKAARMKRQSRMPVTADPVRM